MAADPWWLENSLLSYYNRVERIVVSYDQDGLSWTGTPLPVDECIDRIKAIDADRKCVFMPGHFARLDRHPLDNDTHQRQVALEQAGNGADWVLQLDTDEVVGDSNVFFDCLTEADDCAAEGMDYPARWLYNRVGDGFKRGLWRPGRLSDRWFIERSRRWWGVAAGYPGPVAVRSGTILSLCRQADLGLFRVDFRAFNTDPHHPFDAIVHRVIDASAGIFHFSWVRDLDYMRRKMGWSGHTEEYSEPERLRHWRSSANHPWRTVLSSPFRDEAHRFRISRLPDSFASWRGEDNDADV